MCGSKFNFQHTLSYKRVGFVIIRHNQIINTAAKLLKEKSGDVQLELRLQKLSGEQVEVRIINKCDDCLDISAMMFRSKGII